MTRIPVETIERRELLKAIARLPDPEQYARDMRRCFPRAAEMLCAATRISQGPQKGIWRVDDRAAPTLFKLGLVEARGTSLGTFGNRVRIALLEAHEAGGTQYGSDLHSR